MRKLEKQLNQPKDWNDLRDFIREEEDSVNDLKVKELQWRIRFYNYQIFMFTLTEEDRLTFTAFINRQKKNLRLALEELEVLLDSYKGTDISHLWTPCRMEMSGGWSVNIVL